MAPKKFLYEFQSSDLKDFEGIERDAFRKADELNDKILDLKIMIDEINEEWEEYIQFLEDERISKYCYRRTIIR